MMGTLVDDLIYSPIESESYRRALHEASPKEIGKAMDLISAISSDLADVVVEGDANNLVVHWNLTPAAAAFIMCKMEDLLDTYMQMHEEW
jgi:hypothetical protein